MTGLVTVVTTNQEVLVSVITITITIITILVLSVNTGQEIHATRVDQLLQMLTTPLRAHVTGPVIVVTTNQMVSAYQTTPITIPTIIVALGNTGQEIRATRVVRLLSMDTTTLLVLVR